MHTVIRNLFSIEEVKDLKDMFFKQQPTKAIAVNSKTIKHDTNKSRRAIIYGLNPNNIPKHFTDKLMRAITQHFDGNYLYTEMWSLNEYSYKDRGEFKWHSDVLDYFLYHEKDLDLPPDEVFLKNIRPKRKISVSVAFNDRRDYNGGQFIIDVGDGKQTPIDLNTGDAVIFTSDTMHGVEPVTEGIRHALVVWLNDKKEQREWEQIVLEHRTGTS